MAKVTGIGGVFFTVNDVEATKKWYQDHLGIESNQYGGHFEWRDKDHPEQRKLTAWSPFSDQTSYFNPKQRYMINYRVDNLEELLEELKAQNVTILGGPEKYDYGKFAWIEDPDGNRVELWEPNDEALL